jgi:hypothetical protein
MSLSCLTICLCGRFEGLKILLAISPDDIATLSLANSFRGLKLYGRGLITLIQGGCLILTPDKEN